MYIWDEYDFYVALPWDSELSRSVTASTLEMVYDHYQCWITNATKLKLKLNNHFH